MDMKQRWQVRILEIWKAGTVGYLGDRRVPEIAKYNHFREGLKYPMMRLGWWSVKNMMVRLLKMMTDCVWRHNVNLITEESGSESENEMDDGKEVRRDCCK